MKESDYIDATNLVKIRTAKQMVRDIHPVCKDDELNIAAIVGMLMSMESIVEKRVLIEFEQ